MELVGAGLRLNLDGSRTISAVLRAVVGTHDADFGDGVEARIRQQGRIAAVIHVVTAVDFPVVVFRTATVDAIGDGRETLTRLVLTRLVGRPGRQREELCVV